MITGEDIQRCHEEKQGVQLVVIDTMQFFEIEIPSDVDPEEYINTDECLRECARRILNQTTDLEVDRVLTVYDPEKKEWIS